MSPNKGSFLTVAVLLLHLRCSQADDIQCTTNLCPKQERCLKRDGPGNVTFVCECMQEQLNDDVQGYDCTKRSGGVFRTLNNCYGESCRTGSFTSPNYPNPYNIRDSIMMALYIPHATHIHFEFGAPFWLEEGKDALYVGKGLEVYHSDLDQTEFTFLGKVVPSNFTLDSDTAWMVFISDISGTYDGFNISWTAEVDFEAPKVTFCPPNQTVFVRQGIKTKKITWREPNVTSYEPYTMTNNVPPDRIFPVGTTTVWYRFADVFENADLCEFTITMNVDDESPVFHGCPDDLSRNVSLSTTNLHISWKEPYATDNSNMSLIVNTTLRPGVPLSVGIHQVDYLATDPFGNQGHCNFQINITVLEEEEPPRPIINEILPLVICGGLFTIISCIFCLLRSVKKSNATRETVSRSNQQNNPTEPRSSSSGRVHNRAFSWNSSTDSQALASSNS